MQPGTKVIEQRNIRFGLNAKPNVWDKSNASLSNCLLISKHVGGCIMLWVCLTLAKTGEFFRMTRNRMELSTGKILEENLVQSAFHQTLGDKFKTITFNTKPQLRWSCLPRRQ